MHALLLFAFFQAGPSSAALRASCAEDDPQVAIVSPADRIQVETAVAGGDQTCYRVVLTLRDKRVTGYVLGEQLPAIAAFVRRREKASEESASEEARLLLAKREPPPNQQEAPKPANPFLSTPFENFSGIDTQGKAVSLSGMRGRAIIVSFWSPKSGESQSQLTSVMPLYNEFHKSGLQAVGVSMDPNPSHITEGLDDVTLPWPQIADRSGLAAHYRVDPKEGEVFVLDSSHRVVAAGKMDGEMEGAIRKLLSAPESR